MSETDSQTGTTFWRRSFVRRSALAIGGFGLASLGLWVEGAGQVKVSNATARPPQRHISLNGDSLLVQPTGLIKLGDKKLTGVATTTLLERSGSTKADIPIPIVIPHLVAGGSVPKNPGEFLLVGIGATVSVKNIHLNLPKYRDEAVSTTTSVTVRNCSSQETIVSPTSVPTGLSVQEQLPKADGSVTVYEKLSYVDGEHRLVTCDGFSVGNVHYSQSADAKILEWIGNEAATLLPGASPKQPHSILDFTIPA